MTNLDTFLGALLTFFDGFGHKLLTFFDGFDGLVLSGTPENSKVKIKIKKNYRLKHQENRAFANFLKDFFRFENRKMSSWHDARNNKATQRQVDLPTVKRCVRDAVVESKKSLPQGKAETKRKQSGMKKNT